MNLNDIPVMASLVRRMKWLNENQRAISENIANADTPGYKPVRPEEQDFSKLVHNMAGTAAGQAVRRQQSSVHVAGVRGLGSNFAPGSLPRTEATVYEDQKNGNAVVLEEEMMKLADNQMEYSLVTNLYKKNVGLLKAAMGKGGR